LDRGSLAKINDRCLVLTHNTITGGLIGS
jgi:hypothetical protein